MPVSLVDKRRAGRGGYAMAEVKRTGRQRHAGRAAAAVVGVVVAHRRPLIQWREVPLSPSQSQHSPSLFLLSTRSRLFPFPFSARRRQGLSLTHSLTHAYTHTHTRAGTHTLWLNSGRLSDGAHAGRISPLCRRSSPLWLSPLFCVCASECMCV